MFSSQKMQEWMALILLIGTSLALALVIIGGSIFLLQSGNVNLQTELIQTESHAANMQQIFRSITPLSIIETGLLILVATQSLRVALLVFYYMTMRDAWFTLISIFILFVLIYSFI